MLDVNRFAACFLLCWIAWVILPAGSSVGQESEVQANTTSEAKDTDFLFSGEVPKTIEELRQMESRFAEISEKVKSATVNIQMSHKRTDE